MQTKKTPFILLLLVASSLTLFAQPQKINIVAVGDNVWADPKREAEVQAQVERFVECGFNTIALGTFKFMPMHYVDYSRTKFPEAQSYDAKKIEQNVATLRKNIQYAKSKGVKYFITQSYCHYVPYAFWKAHQAELNPNGLFTPLLEKAHQNDMYWATMEGKNNLIPQQQWTNATYKNFFIESTKLMLDAIPEIDGCLNSYSEAAWTYDTLKLRKGDWKSWKDAVNYDETNNQFVDYCNTLYGVYKEKRGENCIFGMRDWYVKNSELKRLNISKEKFIISVKYGGFDQPIVNYPPWGKDLLDEGYSVVLDLHIFRAEHPHPLYWYSSDFINKMFRNFMSAGFTGISYQDFLQSSKDDPENPIRLLVYKNVAACLKGKDFSRKEALNFLSKYYGKGAEDLLSSLECVENAQEQFIKLAPAWFWRGDGLTPGGLTPRSLWLLKDNPEAPERMGFARQNVVGIPDYVAAMLKGEQELKSAVDAWHKAGKKTPDDVIATMLQQAEQCITLAVEARKKAPSSAPHIDELVASAVIHRQLVLRDVAYLRAAIDYFVSGGQYDGKYVTDRAVANLIPTGIDKTDDCMEQLRLVMYHDQIMRGLCKNYAPRRPEMRSAKDYDNYKRLAGYMKKTFEIPAFDQSYYNEQEKIIKRK